MRNRAKTPTETLSRFVGAACVLACTVALGGCAGLGKEKTLPDTGTWYRIEDGARKNALTFLGERKYRLHLRRIRRKFDGNYWLTEDNAVKFVDTYCGTKLPGLYTYEYVSKDTFRLGLKEDRFCARSKLFEGVWHRAKEESLKATVRPAVKKKPIAATEDENVAVRQDKTTDSPASEQ